MPSLIPLSILAILAAAFLAPALHRRVPRGLGVALGLVPLAAFANYALMLPGVGAGTPVTFSLPWAPALGITLSFFVDGLSLLFLLVISGIGVFVVWHAAGYLKGDANLGKFYLYLLSFMAAMLGLVAADHVILLFIFWELTSITSYLLIGYYHESKASRTAALQALLVTGGGGLAMLAGLILLGLVGGSFEISKLLALPAGAITGHPLYPAILVLILLGAFTKSAQFPFHFWLPNAMEAPAPVSSFLHSATMVKAGVFLLARLHPVLADHALWLAIVAPVGALTMLTGVFQGLRQTDLKKILAYTTLAVLGTLTLLLGLGTDLALKAAMAYLLAHALYKAALFMAAGSVDHETGTRDIDQLGGLRRAMPLTAAAALVAALSMAGLPLFLGFVSKEYFYKALLDAPGPPYLWETLGVAASVALFALALLAGLKPFWGAPRPTPRSAHEAPWTMWIGPLVLGVLSLKMGLFPGWIGEQLVLPAARAVIGDAGYDSPLKLWHGWTPALGLSALTVAAGLALLPLTGRLRAHGGILPTLDRIGPERGYFALLDGLLAFARIQTRFLQNGYLRSYILVTGAFTTGLLLWLLPRNAFRLEFAEMAPLTPIGVAVCALIAGGAIMACVADSRFTAVLALGVVGLGIAVLFLLFSAPDLALTQILVETLTVVLFVLAFYKLPLLKQFSRAAVRWRDAIFAVIFGGAMSALVMIAFHFGPGDPPISQYMAENSFPLGHGRNVVNVILVDFRALDTLGEIVVLGIAALGVAAMLKLRPRRREDREP